MAKDGDWEFHQLFGVVKLIDGSEQKDGLVMRLMMNEIWVYRAASQAEIEDYNEREAR